MAALARVIALSGARVVAVVLDATHGSVAAAGLDGVIKEETRRDFAMPSTYRGMLSAIERIAAPLLEAGPPALGLGISTPGLMDRDDQTVILSPNLPATDGRSPARDLAERLVARHDHTLVPRPPGDHRGIVGETGADQRDQTGGIRAPVRQDRITEDSPVVISEHGIRVELGCAILERLGNPSVRNDNAIDSVRARLCVGGCDDGARTASDQAGPADALRIENGVEVERPV